MSNLLKSLKPFVGPAIIFLTGLSTNIMEFKSDWVAGLLMGIAIFWAVIALLANKALLSRYPKLVDWMPFLNPVAIPQSVSELTDSVLSKKHIRIADLAVSNTVANRIFEDCDIYGPAVLALTTPTEIIVNCEFDASAEQVFIEVAKKQKFVVGPIKLVGCMFRRCRFHGVGILGDPAQMAKLKRVAANPSEPRTDAKSPYENSGSSSKREPIDDKH